jgi:thiol-disulfide isomerase/thioredoxin
VNGDAPRDSGTAKAKGDDDGAGTSDMADVGALRPASASSGPGFFTRLGLAIAHPRWALTVATDRAHVGRSGSDLILAMLILLVGTQLRGLATAVWLGGEVSPGLGVRAAARVLTAALTVDLGLLLLGAVAVYALAGPKRNLGRAFDLACVAALPLLFVDLGATVAVRAVGVAVPSAVGWLLTGLSYGWMGTLIALALRPARIAPRRVPPPPAALVTPARRLGWAVAAIAAIGVVVQIVWIRDNLDLVKPMKTGDQAPAFVLPAIGPGGTHGAPVALSASRGKIIVLDFWATWCKPCLASLPKLDRLARAHPDVAVVTINSDDAAAARALFDQRGYVMTLLEDDGDVSQRYGVTAIPHTVIIDRHGVIREVVRGTGTDLAALVEALRTAE